MQQKSRSAARRRRGIAEDLLLALVGVALGLAVAIGYGIWRAANVDPGTSALGQFGATMLFPGTLIIAAITAMVWLGWKANIDD